MDAGVPGTTENADDAGDVSPSPLATIVYPLAAFVSTTFVNLATPLTAFALVVPPSAPPPGFDPSASWIAPVKLVTALPAASSAVTTIVPSVEPATTEPGSTDITSCEAAPTIAVAVAVNVAGALSPATAAVAVCCPRSAPSVHVSVATPFASVCVVAFASAPPPDATAHATFTPGVALPYASCSTTDNGAPRSAESRPDWLFPPVIAMAAGAAGPMSNARDVAEVSPFAVAERVYALAAFVSSTFANVATPLTAFAVSVPPSVAPPGFVPSATATAPV